ncbi:unnamed protein product [Diamesa hyperborea]
MAAKVIKVLIIKNDLNSVEKEIYCVKLNLNEELAGLKEKLYIRCSLLKDLDYQIFWIDSENDEILITCDDDFKFFVDESHVSKLFIKIIQDETTGADEQPIRKRLHSQSSDDQQSKKLRAQMQNIDLSTSASSLSDLEGIISQVDLTATSSSSSLKRVDKEVIKDGKKAKANEVMMEVDSNSSKVMETAGQTKPNILNVEYLPDISLQSRQEIVATEANVTATSASSSIKHEEEEVIIDVNETAGNEEQMRPNKIVEPVTKGNSTIEDNIRVYECAPPASIEPPPQLCVESIITFSKKPKRQRERVVILDISSEDEVTVPRSTRRQEPSNISQSSAYAFAGNILNGELAQPSFSESTQRPCNPFQVNRSQKSSKLAQEVKKNKARLANLKAQLRCGSFQMHRDRELEHRNLQGYIHRAQQNANRAQHNPRRARQTTGSRRVFSNNTPPIAVLPPQVATPLLHPIPPNLYANIQQSVEDTLRRSRDTILLVDDMNQRNLQQF